MPLTMRQHDANLHQPALCELLPIRDYLDSVLVRSNGALVAGYDLGGINSYYHSDETRNQTKYSLEALGAFADRAIDANAGAIRGSGRRRRPATEVQGSTSFRQRGGAEPGPPPPGCLAGARTVGLLSPAAPAHVLLLGPADSS